MKKINRILNDKALQKLFFDDFDNQPENFEFIIGDILTAFEDGFNILVHQVNCQGVMGAGLALKLRQTYPELYNKYRKYWDVRASKKVDYENILGDAQLVKVSQPLEEYQAICNLFGQLNTGRYVRQTNYEGFYNGLWQLKDKLQTQALEDVVDTKYSIAFPYKIGCGLAGGSWRIIYSMIREVFGDTEVNDRKIGIYILEKDLRKDLRNDALVNMLVH